MTASCVFMRVAVHEFRKCQNSEWGGSRDRLHEGEISQVTEAGADQRARHHVTEKVHAEQNA